MNAICVNLQPEVSSELAAPLTVLSVTVQDSRFSAPVDLVFCNSDLQQVKEMRASYPQAAVIVVSRLPNVSEWLDCIEAGAADYCSAPFEVAQLRWVIDSSLRSTRQALAA